MVDFEQLQRLWQNQPRGPDILDAGSLTRALRRYGRRQDWINAIKLALLLPILSMALMGTWHSPWTVSGAATIAVGSLWLLAMDWRDQRAISRMNFAAPSVGFVRGAVDRLMEQREPFRKRYWPFLLVMVGGVNLILLGNLAGAPLLRRVMWHAIDSAMPFAVYELGRKVRIRRFESECRPLVERLTAIERALEERTL